ncbi:MAG TPA: tetratricopeptide repeat protein [Vicinamibacterales bacterium]|nr:tetratricopeptide repeat protein [Vicinamibacterales bacterium]
MESRGEQGPDGPRADDTRSAGLVSTFRAGDLLCNRFRVSRFIARGGMGELYEAEDLTLGERVALKTIRAEIAVDARANQRFRREVQLARKVTHPNICRIFDLFEHLPAEAASSGAAAAIFVTMELLEGETVSQRLRRNGPFAPEQALPIVQQMAAALTAAHAAGIVHRDFKSNNVMLLDAGPGKPPRAVVTDFGLAHIFAGAPGRHEPTITITGDLVGTPEYMAPEQLEDAPLTPATDIYALGIVIYEMVTGERPFAADTPIASALRRLSGPGARAPREVNPDLPVAWDRAIMRCLARYPAGRFPRAMDVADALASRPATKQWAPGWRVAALAVSAVAVAIAGGLFWAGSNAGTRSDPTSRPAADAGVPNGTVRPAVAVLGFRNLAGREDTQWLSTALSEMLTTELSAGERLRTIPGENVTRMKTELALADADSYAPETIERIRQNLGTDLVVFGSYVTVGEGVGSQLRVDIRLQDSRAGQTMSVSETGRSSELLDVVSRAGMKLRERLGVDAVPATVASIRALQPGSSEAVRLYAEGLTRLRRFDALGARSLLDRAIQADPTYPLAHSALANTWSSLGYDSRAKDAAARAFELSANLPRADRLQVEGTYREMANALPEAIAIWQTLATFFPDDVEHALRLANAQITSGAAKDGLATIESFRQRFPAAKDPRLDLAETLAAETLSDFKRMQTAAAAAGAAGQAQGARLLVAAARLREGAAALRLGQTDRSVSLLQDARGIYAEAGDRAGVARTLNNLASAISDGPDTARTRALYEEGLTIARAIGEQDLVARFLNNIAIQERRAGNLRASLKMNQASLAIRREIGDRTNMAVSLNNIGNVLLDLGDLQGASQHYEESAAMSRDMGDRRSMARALYNAAESFKLQGQIARARATYDEALKIRRGIDDPAGVATSLYGVGHIAAVQGDMHGAKQSLTEALEMDRRLDRRRPMAYSIYQLGEIALVEGDLAGARKRHEEALDIRTTLGEKGTAAESRAALAWLALEEGKAAEAEALARDAAMVFKGQAAPDNEAMARATMALAMVAQGRRALADGEIAQAQSLVNNPQHALARMPVAIAAARVAAAGNPAAAVRTLEAIRADAVGRGIPRYELDARRALAEIEGRRSLTAGATLIEALRKDAKARGFGLYAR